MFGISFQRFYHRLVLGHLFFEPLNHLLFEPFGASWACCWTASSGNPGRCPGTRCCSGRSSGTSSQWYKWSLQRNNTLTLSLMFQYFFSSFIKSVRPSAKSFVLTFLPNFEFLSPPADRSDRKADKNYGFSVVWWVFSVKTTLNFDFKLKDSAD